MKLSCCGMNSRGILCNNVILEIPFANLNLRFSLGLGIFEKLEYDRETPSRFDPMGGTPNSTEYLVCYQFRPGSLRRKLLGSQSTPVLLSRPTWQLGVSP
ncbi:hypothetical protein An06g02268 [Aspergillus niger]|uniref:Uncharacterized protein n=2 Tax=Aspergillus niger TaxID=5061 RepID=A2QLS5_ASPNC|nr:hypothetical protein An06g02268 [Aspergillus niger]CAK48070.1 hypothetical protein An06g02268 [Aspergillus niger]